MKEVMIINTFTMKAEKMDEFIALQKSFSTQIAWRIKGWVGSRMYRSLDDKTAVLISIFDSTESQEMFLKSDEFRGHIESVKALIESAQPGRYEVAYVSGNFR